MGVCTNGVLLFPKTSFPGYPTALKALNEAVRAAARQQMRLDIEEHPSFSVMESSQRNSLVYAKLEISAPTIEFIQMSGQVRGEDRTISCGYGFEDSHGADASTAALSVSVGCWGLSRELIKATLLELRDRLGGEARFLESDSTEDWVTLPGKP